MMKIQRKYVRFSGFKSIGVKVPQFVEKRRRTKESHNYSITIFCNSQSYQRINLSYDPYEDRIDKKNEYDLIIIMVNTKNYKEQSTATKENISV